MVVKFCDCAYVSGAHCTLRSVDADIFPYRRDAVFHLSELQFEALNVCSSVIKHNNSDEASKGRAWVSVFGQNCSTPMLTGARMRRVGCGQTGQTGQNQEICCSKF